MRLVALFTLFWGTPLAAKQTLFAITRSGAEFVCADLNDMGATTTDTVGSWILGFWSGINVANDARVGGSTTSNGVVGEVKLHCRKHPSKSLGQATFDTYQAMKKAGK